MRTGVGVVLLLAGTALVVACAQPAAPTPEERAALAASEAVSPLRGDTSSYRIIYHPAVDLAKRPAS